MQSVKMNEWAFLLLCIGKYGRYESIVIYVGTFLYLFFCFVLRKQRSHVNPTQGVINEAPGQVTAETLTLCLRVQVHY